MAATSNINGGGTVSMHENPNSVLGLQTKSHDHDSCATKMKSGDTKAVMSNTKGGGSHEQGGSLLGLKKGFLFGKPSVTRKLAKSGAERSLVLGSPNEIRNPKLPKGAGITDLEAKDIASNVAEIRSPNHHRSPNEGWSSNDNGKNNPNTDRISVSLEETMTKQPGFLVDCHNNNGQPGIQGIIHENRDVHVMADDGTWAKESEEGVEHGKLDQFKVNSEMGLYGLHSPKKAMDRNDNLLAIMANTANQKDQEVIEQPKIQFGSFTYNEGS
ncbi:hypothetical protein FRX31_023741 [Thalictrum thalictroides]|uniref:Uncharacterized protein n=1 Tax=Thalictrum thalictroides TaxID=46969 RepID=A0A7J6VQN0_THATH|nr:hypothetical protein FRX31_023741 [Thalictrum thalictroides]